MAENMVQNLSQMACLLVTNSIIYSYYNTLTRDIHICLNRSCVEVIGSFTGGAE
jgi:hypothetical protein